MEFKQGDIVQVKNFAAFDFCGKVCGQSSKQPILGTGYIIELAQTLIDYPYSHIITYEVYMTKVDRVIINPDLQMFSI
jgi:hypothetical protein